MAKAQDDISRRRRLMQGCCPTHGIPMPQVGVARDEHGNPVGPEVACPRKDCGFKVEIRMGTKLYDSLFGNPL